MMCTEIQIKAGKRRAKILAENVCGLGACIESSNAKIIKLIHALLTKLMSLFPNDSSAQLTENAAHYEELGGLYSTVRDVS